ncbi:MAG: AsmA-like C-terminal region-containing protein, partial [Desulfobacterales bacterium]
GLINKLLARQRFPVKLSGTFSEATVNLDGTLEDALNLHGIDLKVQTSGKNLAKLKLPNNIRLPETSAFDLKGQLRGSKESLAFKDANGNLAGSNFKLAFSGFVGDLISISGIDMRLKGSGKDLAKIGAIIDQKLPATDEFAVEGRLTGSAKDLSLQAAQGSARRGGLSITLDGGIKDLIALKGLDVKVQASGKDLAKLGAIVDQKLPATDQFTFQGKLIGSAKVLSLQRANGSARRGNLSVALNGGVEDLIAFSGVDLKLKGSGKDLAEVGAIFDRKLPATDKFALEGRLTGSAKSLSLLEANGSASRGSSRVDLSGEVKNLIAFSGLDLQLNGSGKNLAEIGSIIGEKLPATDEFAVEGRLMGSAETLSLQNAYGQARQGGLILTVNGRINDLQALSGLDLKVDGAGRDLSEVGTIIGQKLPATGEFTVKGRLTGSTRALALRDSQGRVRRGGLRLSLDGGIENLLALTGIDIKFEVSGADLAEVGPIIEEKLPTTDNFSVQGRLTGSTTALSLREATGQAGRDGMSVAFDGGVTDVLSLGSIDIRLKASGEELAAIGPLVGSDLPQIGPFDVRGHLIGSPKLLLLKDFSATVDKSDFKGLAKVQFRKRPKITVRLESSVIDFTRITGMAKKDEQAPGETDRRERRLFPDDPLPFDALQKVDVDIVLKARNIRMKDARLEFGHLTLILADSNLSIDKLEATYKETKISGNLHIDPGSPPQVATNFLVQGFNLGEFLRETGRSNRVRGIVDIAAHGKSSGNSVSSLMANLDGAFGAVMGPGYLTKYLDLLSMDLSTKVIPFWGRHKQADEINCAVVQFDIDNGVADSKAFVFDTQIGILSAKGDTNLGSEQVNFLLHPRPKDFSLVTLSKKVRVTGTIMNPKVRPDTLSLIERGAEGVLGYLVLGPLGLLAPFVHLGAHEKHPCDIQSLGQLGLQSPAPE